MKDILAAAVAAAAVILLFIVARSVGERARARAGAAKAAPPRSGSPGEAGAELVAVIAAAVAAASGLDASSFRIVGLRASPVESGRRGLNTPVWGHVDRFNRGEGL
jgi:hypothetical protein